MSITKWMNVKEIDFPFRVWSKRFISIFGAYSVFFGQQSLINIEIKKHFTRYNPFESTKNNTHCDYNCPYKQMNERLNSFLGEVKHGVANSNFVEKPPNILIYTNSNEETTKNYTKAHTLLSQCLNINKYAMYHLKYNEVMTTPWVENTIILILAVDKIPKSPIGERFLNYFYNGGLVISLTCSFDEYFLKKSKLNQHNEKRVIKLNYKKWTGVSVVGNGNSYEQFNSFESDGVFFTTLAEDSETLNPLVVYADHKKSSAKALFSQINFEKDVSDIKVNLDLFVDLKDSNSNRIEIFKSLLIDLGLNCDHHEMPSITPLLMFASNEILMNIFQDAIYPELKNGQYNIKENSYRFISSENYLKSDNKNIDNQHNIVITDGNNFECQFNFNLYKQHLQTKTLGQLVFYGDVIGTTMNIVDNFMLQMPDNLGFVAIASTQTSGQGRGGNVWLSPKGCGMFSLHIRLNVDSPLGLHVSCIQHLVALAAVLAVREKSGYEEINLRIKWPNDIYFSDKFKLGGILTKSTIFRDTIHINLGCGVNVSNHDPTVCINDLIILHNSNNPHNLPLFSTEEFLARIITKIEQLIEMFQSNNDYFFYLYHKYWLHRDQAVTLNDSNGPKGTIQGLTKFGFLSVRLEDGDIVEVHPDGNSFDMMKNLIAPKYKT